MSDPIRKKITLTLSNLEDEMSLLTPTNDTHGLFGTGIEHRSHYEETGGDSTLAHPEDGAHEELAA